MRTSLTSFFLAATLLLLPLARTGQPQSNPMNGSKIATVLQPSNSPLVTFRLLFQTGAAADPTGKEGVASLTAALLAEGGSRAQTYERHSSKFCGPFLDPGQTPHRFR